jgi:hypothetical protein
VPKPDQLTAAVAAQPAPSRRAVFIWLGVLAAFLLLYGFTAQRSVAWQDSGAFQWRIVNFQLASDQGLALSHPMLIVLGKLFSLLPVGPLAWRINMLSAVMGALAAANLALLVHRLLRGMGVPTGQVPPVAAVGIMQGPVVPALVAAGFFGLAHTTWWLSTISESQAIYAAIFTLELNLALSLVNRPQAIVALLLGVVNGLGFCTHNLALLASPGYGLIVIYMISRRQLPWRALPMLLVGWAAGASGMLAMTVDYALHVGAAAAVRSALFGDAWEGAVLVGSLANVKMGLLYPLYNFPNLALPLAAVGAWALRRRVGGPMAALLAYMTVIYFVFAVRYRVADQFMFYVEFYAMVAVLAGVGLADVATWRALRRFAAALAILSLSVQVAFYANAPQVWQRFHLPAPKASNRPYLDAMRYWLVPWKMADDSADRYAREALAEHPGAFIIADTTSYYPLLWATRVEKAGQALVIVASDATPEAVPRDVKVYVTSDEYNRHPKWMDSEATFAKDGLLYRVKWN